VRARVCVCVSVSLCWCQYKPETIINKNSPHNLQRFATFFGTVNDTTVAMRHDLQYSCRGIGDRVEVFRGGCPWFLSFQGC
jgi:hypothetical protein